MKLIEENGTGLDMNVTSRQGTTQMHTSDLNNSFGPQREVPAGFPIISPAWRYFNEEAEGWLETWKRQVTAAAKSIGDDMFGGRADGTSKIQSLGSTD
ncbi:uncharacterized protein HMPREF1541_05321 [Cyphellophora europaea CBS 101466]|uniref:Uncharacterized protein n=1 Tax=Cyphellophora europaea (strain CBS 101466) TaxID=1220924 RepID=W2RTQ5_CYPE1|nr:uncharacterized protein HMPREF1541_05321 [Cyphellophora europaea CBS 101466]ETN39099.1 hypothetical protein HMPREF1541_05321 [Cyphellophora europaea CBS 101466]